MSTEAAPVDRIMREIEALGYGTPEYHEAMWFLLSVMARRQYAMADHLRWEQRKQERAAETRARNKAAREVEKCGHGEVVGQCASCAACLACRGECGVCPYGNSEPVPPPPDGT